MLSAKCNLLFLDKINASVHKMLIICSKRADFLCVVMFLWLRRLKADRQSEDQSSSLAVSLCDYWTVSPYITTILFVTTLLSAILTLTK